MKQEQGQSLVEVILLGLVLLVPLIWAFGVLSQLHLAALATGAAAREGGNAAAHSVDPSAAREAIDMAVAGALEDHGLDPSKARVRWFTGRSLHRGVFVELEVSYPVPVATAPLIGSAGGPALWIESSHVAVVDPFASRDE